MKTYNNITKLEAIRATIKMEANYGGTDFLTPLELAKKVDQSIYKRRIFILTDGNVDNKLQVVNSIEDMCKKNDNVKVFTFGIGSGCDKDLVQRCSDVGNGFYSIVEDGEPKELKIKVVRALWSASEPALQDCSFYIAGEDVKLG